MNRDAAKVLVKRTFNQHYDETSFRELVNSIFKDLEHRNQTLAGNYIADAFRDHISSYKRLGKFVDAENNTIDVLAVKLKGNSKLERARTMQRNFIARYLDGGRGEQREAALTAFYSEDTTDWRFSLVRMDYRLDFETGKTTKEISPARRYSFLVGASEQSHTAQSQLLPLLTSEIAPTLDELEETFNIESVTKEFFAKYKSLYLNLKEELDTILEQDAKVKVEFESKSINSSTFAKRLLGQVVFLYFLQKKGWLGVKREGSWGSAGCNTILLQMGFNRLGRK